MPRPIRTTPRVQSYAQKAKDFLEIEERHPGTIPVATLKLLRRGVDPQTEADRANQSNNIYNGVVKAKPHVIAMAEAVTLTGQRPS